MAYNTQDLIDFFDDVVKTPQNTVKKEDKIEDLQIKMLEEFLKTTNNEKGTLTPEQDEEYKKFFDKYERNCKTDSAVQTKHEVPYHLNKENSDKEVPSCSRCFNLPPVLLEDELSVKNIFIEETSNREKAYLSYIVDKPKVLTPKLNEDNNFNEDLIDEVLIEKNIEINNRKDYLKNDNYKFDVFDSNKINSNDFAKKSNVDESKSSNEYEDIMNEIISKNEIKCYGIKEVKNSNKIADEHFKLKTKEEKDFINTLVTKYNLTYLEPVKKVEKTFKKRCLLKSDFEKVDLTPGPTLYEKAIVLPKIMKQLEDRKLEKDKKVERKLILGSGYSNYRNYSNDAKKDETFLNSQKVKNVPKVVNNEVASSKSEHNKKGVVTDNKILEPPKLVMEDCNRERLIAFEARRRFQNFIRTGNYFTEES